MPADRQGAIALLALLALLALEVRADDGEAAPPELEFLEYLGTLVRENDEWLDPSDLRGPAEAERDLDASREAAVNQDVERAGAESTHDGGLE